MGEKAAIGNVLDVLKKKTSCGTEECVIDKAAANNIISYTEQRRIMNSYFRPKGPDDPTAWLSNFEIDDILDQVAKKHPNFLHIYFHMRDFAQNGFPYDYTLKDLDFPQIMRNEKKNMFGVVINTDTSSGSGIHWFAVFGDFRRPPYTIEYFNSAGGGMPSYIRDWMTEKANKWSLELKEAVNQIVVSSVGYQDDSYSCGTYALYYIMARLAGSSYTDFQNRGDIINDETMRRFREYLFR